MRRWKTSNYNLPATVQKLIEEIDGEVPAPVWLTAPSTALPTTLQVTPDKRGEDAVVVDLRITGGADVSRINIIRGDFSLMDGVVPANSLIPSTTFPGQRLQVPIHLPPSTPLKVAFSALPSETISGNGSVAAQVLYGSRAAIQHVMNTLGEARWWALYSEKGATTRTPTRTVDVGGRPTYGYVDALAAGSFPTSIDILIDGRTMTPSLITAAQEQGVPFLPHEIRANQVYGSTFIMPSAVNDAAWVVWHGPSEPQL